MSKFFIREWAGISGFQGGMPVPSGLIREQTALDFSGGHQESLAFADSTKLVEWSTDAICGWTVMQKNDAVGIATINSVRYPADSAGFVGVSAGQKLSVITQS